MYHGTTESNSPPKPSDSYDPSLYDENGCPLAVLAAEIPAHSSAAINTVAAMANHISMGHRITLAVESKKQAEYLRQRISSKRSKLLHDKKKVADVIPREYLVKLDYSEGVATIYCAPNQTAATFKLLGIS
jgi:hypothetical protein